ncbi:hypothetical protein GUITHDRAFT_116469 [Guillardia theta CCMP2712]|uniref:Thioredoxin domain-containing protein n=1 Tax=Guillardia theta (strain CCMP2712) TaxID=905079 RepID=L1IM90_GUITC|nr:hypothetical protein GUITHDRAFT_116469 [Guillardia theta CCMP2712]EKX37356.1 hypothetical protein GUITHDRAFT_116469 [Guillardia theta CCMP2712]|eukprot:XP_005824336.1 hypothetical protein GUITHDRAFT_116469 [Guillardia theta CCMP2712]
MASRKVTILKIAKQLHAKNVPLKVSLKAASALATLTSLCDGGAGANQDAMDKYRRKVDKNWWSAIRAFTTEEEVKKMVMADTRHAHLLIFVAPGWCQWSQKQIAELQKNFDDLGEAQDRVHLIDVDDPANKELVQFEQVRSFPTIMVVQGNNIIGRVNGYKDFEHVHDMVFADSQVIV